jgi:hypothetical protein
MLACRGGHGAVVQVLITAKVGLNIRNQVRPLNYSACYSAACALEHPRSDTQSSLWWTFKWLITSTLCVVRTGRLVRAHDCLRRRQHGHRARAGQREG